MNRATGWLVVSVLMLTAVPARATYDSALLNHPFQLLPPGRAAVWLNVDMVSKLDPHEFDVVGAGIPSVQFGLTPRIELGFASVRIAFAENQAGSLRGVLHAGVSPSFAISATRRVWAVSPALGVGLQADHGEWLVRASGGGGTGFHSERGWADPAFGLSGHLVRRLGMRVITGLAIQGGLRYQGGRESTPALHGGGGPMARFLVGHGFALEVNGGYRRESGRNAIYYGIALGWGLRLWSAKQEAAGPSTPGD